MTETFFPVVRYAAQDRYWFESEVWRAVLENYMEGQLPIRVIPCGARLVSSERYDEVLGEIFLDGRPAQTALLELQELAVADLRSPDLLACPYR